MVLSFEQEKELLEMKQKHQLKMIKEHLKVAGVQFGYKMDELRLEQRIAKLNTKTREVGT